MNTKKRNFIIAGILLIAIILVGAYGNESIRDYVNTGNVEDMGEMEDMEHSDMSEAETGNSDEHSDGDDHADDDAEEDEEHSPEDHTSGDAHEYIPMDALVVENPFEANEESIAFGAEAFAASCAICHGETGEGDGPAAAGLETQPANLYDSHVMGISDGGLFWVISHGKPDTPMPAWENILSVNQRWHVINFLRSLSN